MLAMHINRSQKHRAILRPAFVFMSIGLLFGASYGAQSTSSSGCTNSTVTDAWGPEFASEAKSFFATLRSVVRNGDKKGVTSLIHYPLRVYGANEAYEIASPADLLRRYSTLFTPDARKAILSQSPDCLFGNGQGVMAAGGRVWFQKQENGEFKIVTLNLIRPK